MRFDRTALAALSFAASTFVFVNPARAQAEVVVPPSPPPPPPSPPPYSPPAADAHDNVLRRLLRSGCRDGLPEARALAASGEATWAETVARVCGDLLRSQAAISSQALHPEHNGRGTLVVASTIYGIWTGISFDVLFSIEEVRSSIVPPLIGMGTGLALSLALTSDRPITNGQAWSIVTGLEYGSFNGALWAGAFDFGAQDVVGTTLATGIAAGTAGLLVASKIAPAQGDVEVVRSGLLWGTIAGMLGVLAVSENPASKSVFRAGAVSMDLGFLVGLAFAASFDVSRTRDLIIDAGTLGGGVAGLGIAVLAEGNNGSGRAVAAGTLAGLLAGMVATIWLTRDLDRPDDDHGPPVAALLGRDERGRWRWGTPGASPVFDGLGRRVVGATFTALGGSF
jgi:hypothetical protein